MRRTAILATVALVLLTVATVARAAPVAPTLPQAPAGPVGPAASTGPAADPAAGSVAGGTRVTGREQVGTVEPAQVTLGYAGGNRSATLHYRGASYVKVHLGRLLLLPGDYVTVADPTGTEVHRYGGGLLPEVGSWLGGGQWAMSITGDTAVVTLHTQAGGGPAPGGSDRMPARLGATIDQVAYGHAPGERAEPPAAVVPRQPRTESICGGDESTDAVCYRDSHPTIYRNSKAVARLLINGVELCTAFRVGPGNRMLTNHHCVSSTRDARRTEVWFNYQCASCGGWAVFRPTKVWGDRLLATDQVLDFALFTLDRFAEVERYGYLELDPRSVTAGERIYIPQHPRGLPGRVALASDRDRGGACRVSDPAAHGYGWHTDVAYYCDTQGGASGSPVLSRDNHRVVALHHFGGCPNSGVRIDLIYEQLRPHLAA